MLGTFKSLLTTMKLALKPPVTAEYPSVAPTLAPRFMAHPVLTWDKDVPEPYCTGCLVCMRICPTDCIDVAMMDNPKHAEGDSSRRKIVDYFDLNVADCIMCGLCVEYCNFDAIIMSDNFDASQYARPNLVFDLEQLLEAGKEQEAKGRWSPPEAKKSQRRAAAQGGGTAAAGAEASSEDRVAAARAKAAELRAQRAAERGEAPPAEATTAAPEQESGDTPAVDPRVAAARAKAAELRAQRAAERGEAPLAEASAPASDADSTEAKPVDPRVAEARRRAAELRAQRAVERAAQEAGNTDSPNSESESDESKPGTDGE
jgi:NADH-quinone oxidoreductase subunit I